MKLAISNLAWELKDEEHILRQLLNKKIHFIECVPKKMYGFNTFLDFDSIVIMKEHYSKYKHLKIVSLQSILFGYSEKIFQSEKGNILIMKVIKEVIVFANKFGIRNIVFGSPQNRSISTSDDFYTAVKFFREIAEFAEQFDIIIAMEPNPKIYKTNFLNTISETIDFVKTVNHKSLMMNLDIGEFIENKEQIEILDKSFKYINHVHISRPYLEKVHLDTITKDVITRLNSLGYSNYLSIEMKTCESGLLISIVDEFYKFIESIVEKSK